MVRPETTLCLDPWEEPRVSAPHPLADGRRTNRPLKTAALALSALAASLALQPLTAPPAAAGINCGSTDPLAPQAGDCDAPQAVITQQPNRISYSPAAVFEMTTAQSPDPDDPNITFECRLEIGHAPDPLQPYEPWRDCSVTNETAGSPSLGRAEYLDLTPGDYTFSVRATDIPEPPLVPLPVPLPIPIPIPIPGIGDDQPNVQAEPTVYEWSVVDEPPTDEDQEGAPDTSIVKSPKRWHLVPYGEVRFRADEPALAFRCWIDGRRLSKEECAVDVEDAHFGLAQFSGMGAGPHEFKVQAIDLAGNIDGTPAVATWELPRNNTSLNKHSRHWQQRRGNGYFQTTYSFTKEKGAKISQGTRDVREIVLVATKCPKCGTLKATFDNKTIAKVDLRAKKEKKRRLIVLKSWRKPQSGRLTLTVTSNGKRVIVEGVGFSRTRG